MIFRRSPWVSAALFAASLSASLATSTAVLAAPVELPPIRIGDINSYSNLPQVILPYRQGWQLAVEEINAEGGLLGRRVEVLSRDDAGKPDEAQRQATDLVNSERVDVLAGTFLSSIGLSVSEVAQRHKKLFVAAEPLTDALVWDRGNRYTFRLRPSTYMQAAMLADEAVRMPAKRWYVVAPNYEYGQSAVSTFKSLLKARRPDVEFVGEQWPALGKLDAVGAVKSALAAKPDALFNVSFGADLVKFVQEGNAHGLFQKVSVLSMLSGEPEYLDLLRDAAPRGWIVTGYPWDQIDTPEHSRFAIAYYKRYGEHPKLASVMGYTTFIAIFDAIRKAKSTDSEKLVVALRDLRFTSPFGPVSFRAIDQQSTMGAYVGRLELRGEGAAARGSMTAWRYVDGATVLPDDAQVTSRRPADARR